MRSPSTPPSPALLLQDGQDPRTRAAAARALDARSLRAVFMDLVGRPPRRAEAQEWLGRGRGELLDDLLGSEEFWAHWWHEQLYYFLLIDNFRPRTRAAKEVPTKLAEGRLHYRDALHQAALTPTFDLRNPGADTFVTVVMEQFCGVVVQDRASELEIGKVAYEGGKGRFLGTTAENQADVIRICVEHRDASRHFLAREHQRPAATWSASSSARTRAASTATPGPISPSSASGSCRRPTTSASPRSCPSPTACSCAASSWTCSTACPRTTSWSPCATPWTTWRTRAPCGRSWCACCSSPGAGRPRQGGDRGLRAGSASSSHASWVAGHARGAAGVRHRLPRGGLRAQHHPLHSYRTRSTSPTDAMHANPSTAARCCAPRRSSALAQHFPPGCWRTRSRRCGPTGAPSAWS